jgi:hypothetical protein
MTSESEHELRQYVHEDELNARELALADAEANEAIAAGVEASLKKEDAGVIQIEDDEEPVKLRKPMAAKSEV